MERPTISNGVAGFPTQRQAEQWARRFDYARQLNGLQPLEVKQQGNQWVVLKPEASFSVDRNLESEL